MKGYLCDIRDSSVLLANKKADLVAADENPKLVYAIPVDNIKMIKIRRAGLITLGISIGAAIGITTIIIRGSSKKLKGAGLDNAYWGALGRAVEINTIIYPTLAGGLIGSWINKKFEINGSMDGFNHYKFTMEKYSYRFQRDVALQTRN